MHIFISQHMNPRNWCLPVWIFLVAGLLSPLVSQAVPAFNKQTGQNCVACHAGGQFPELTPYGRLFKLTGYTIGQRALPLSLMYVVNLNKTKNTTDPNGDVRADFPKDGNLKFDTASLFLAGKISDNMGGFVQITYGNYDAQSPRDSHWQGHTTSDNIDIRYADRFIDTNRDLIVGLTLNNNPTVQDVWNSVPAWGYATVPGSSGPGAAPLLAGGLAQNVAGVGAYAYWNRTLYAELSGYRTANGIFSVLSQGFNTARANQQILKGLNPYWRLALTHEWGAHNAMVGMLGMTANVYADPLDPTGPTTHRFRDVGVDAQYQYLLDPHTITAQASYIKENHRYPDSVGNQAFTTFVDINGNPLNNTNSSDTLNMFRAKVSYVYRAKYGGTLSYFNVTGSTNTELQTAGFDPENVGEFLPAAAPGGNLSGNPATHGWTAEVFWTPVQYARVGLQYTMFSKFNGASSNYDGAGRNAKDNNTIFLYIWGTY